MKTIFIRRHSAVKACAMLAALTALVLCAAFTPAHAVFLNKPLRRIPVYRVETEEKKVAISFDAAYGADKTQGIMDILKDYNAKATFFLVGFWMENNEDMTRRIFENGYEIGTHSNAHAHMSKLSSEQCREDLRQSVETVKRLTGADPKVFRPPFGEYNNTLIESAESLGLMTVQWDVDSLDWKSGSAAEIAERVIKKVKEGSIVLFHNNADHILEVLPIVLDALKMKGFTTVEMSELVLFENYTIDSRGQQCKA